MGKTSRIHDARASTPSTERLCAAAGPQHLQCESARRVTGMGAPCPLGQAYPTHCKRVSCDGVRCMQPPVRRAAVVLRLTLNKAPPSPWSPLKGGHQRFARATRVFPFLFTILGLIG